VLLRFFSFFSFFSAFFADFSAFALLLLFKSDFSELIVAAGGTSGRMHIANWNLVYDICVSVVYKYKTTAILSIGIAFYCISKHPSMRPEKSGEGVGTINCHPIPPHSRFFCTFEFALMNYNWKF
jgi:hypothetical protein